MYPIRTEYRKPPLINDVFGARRCGATITSLSQFNPNTPYGLSGRGWDLWSRTYGDAAGSKIANVALKSACLEIYPLKTGVSGTGSIVSHFQFLPTEGKKYYVEIKAMMGRGGYGGDYTWPAIWFVAGNDPNYTYTGSELDGVETYCNIHFVPSDENGLYTHYYQSTSHDSGGVQESIIVPTDNDITVNWNTYGFEFWLDCDDKVHMTNFLNGRQVQSLCSGLQWTSSPPAILIGWNSTHFNDFIPAILKLDYVRVWESS